MPDRHATKPKAVRLPDGLEARVKAALIGDETVNGFIVAAIEERLERSTGGSTALVAPPPVVFVAADQPQPQTAAKNCKHRNMRGVKGVCPDCKDWVIKQ